VTALPSSAAFDAQGSLSYSIERNSNWQDLMNAIAHSNRCNPAAAKISASHHPASHARVQVSSHILNVREVVPQLS